MSAVTRLVLASANRGKLRELAALLEPLAIELVAQTELGVPSVDETGLSFVENALLKARHAAAATGLPALADDSGIAVAALGGAPGIRSARYAGEGATDAQNVAQLLAALDGSGERGAAFHCALVLVRHAADPVPLIAEGRWPGRIAAAPRGRGGFGYDPVFEFDATGRTAAELAPADKAAISHRGLALRELRRRIATELDGA